MHSCYLVELERSYLLFDYFNGMLQEDYQREIVLPELKEEKWLYVFSSHFHIDHFGIEVLQWKQKRENISYIFSKDIRLGDNFLIRHGYSPEIKEEILFVKPCKQFECRELKSHTLFSTDAGVAYVVEAEGKRIYHAGDLNWWYWDNESDQEKKNMERHYKDYLQDIAGVEIDLAFVPYDPRLQDKAICGIEYFLQVTRTKALFPIHFWGEFDVLENIEKQLVPDTDTEIYLPAQEGDTFLL